MKFFMFGVIHLLLEPLVEQNLTEQSQTSKGTFHNYVIERGKALMSQATTNQSGLANNSNDKLKQAINTIFNV